MFQRGTTNATMPLGNHHVENWGDDSQHTEDTCTDIDTDDKNQVGLFKIIVIYYYVLEDLLFIIKTKEHFWFHNFIFFWFKIFHFDILNWLYT